MECRVMTMIAEYIDEKFSEYVESRLQEWAEWFSHDNWYGLGYPRRNILHRLMTEGLVGMSIYSNYLPNNKNAEEIEALISEMSKQNKNMAYALRIHYLTSGSMRYKANEFHIPRPLLTRYVDMAKQWIAGRLSI
jgi:hypothetical protein